MAGDMLTADRLREVVSYDPETGRFTWRIATSFRVKVGAVAGTASSEYIRIRIDGRTYVGQRLAWLYLKGEWPTHQLDHRDTDKHNNRWLNLRPATQTLNNANIGLRKDSKSGLKGVCWHKRAGRWVANIRINRKGIYLGLFDTAEEAHAAYVAAAQRLFGEYARAA